MPSPDDLLARTEASIYLCTLGFRYSLNTLIAFDSRGEGPAIFERKRIGRGNPAVYYKRFAVVQWAVNREERLRPWNEVTIHRGLRELRSSPLKTVAA